MVRSKWNTLKLVIPMEKQIEAFPLTNILNSNINLLELYFSLQDCEESFLNHNWCYLYPLRQENNHIALISSTHKQTLTMGITNTTSYTMNPITCRDIAALDELELILVPNLIQFNEIQSKPINNWNKHQILRYSLLILYAQFLYKEILFKVIEYSKERKTFGVPIYKHQLVGYAIVSASTEFELNSNYLSYCMEKLLQGKLSLFDFVQDFPYLIDTWLESLDLLTPVMGAFGTTEEAGLGVLKMNFIKVCHALQNLDLYEEE
ncbi:hypothetical protein ACQKJC_12980 [Priestia koreensis]|uniref:hypothetical protein n=1 Tax=Priestia koreensis TaxID=284581 RepID=UPI003D079BBC